MIGTLSEKQIDYVLQSEILGRIGCYAKGKVYIVPVNYVYHDGCIYAHSHEGMKIHMMRQHRQVCFEVEQIDNYNNWRTVVLWGEFEELSYPGEGSEGLRLLQERLYPYLVSDTVTAAHGQPLQELPGSIEKKLRPVTFRININERNGRFEKKP